MQVLTPGIQSKIAAAAGVNFTIATMPKDGLFFVHLELNNHNFYLHCEFLSEEEVLKVAAILKEVYDEFPTMRRFNSLDTNLNAHKAASSDFVRSVLSIKSSALHKLLLLTSGNYLLWKLSSDRVIALAKAKKELCSDPRVLMDASNLYRDLKNMYILPGVGAKTVIYGDLPSINSHSANVIDRTARLMAFIANNSKISFSEHVKLDFAESIATQETLPDFSQIISTRRLMDSHHQEIAESMIASHLCAISSFVTKVVDKGIFPERILRNRAAALTSASLSLDEIGLTSVLSFLSAEERSSFASFSFAENLNSLLRNCKIGAYTPPIIYAALAEVLATRGLNKAFEVAREMKHLKFLQEFDLKIYEATIALIAEALDSEHDEFPFSWSAQFSEHAWVFTAQQADNRELAVML